MDRLPRSLTAKDRNNLIEILFKKYKSQADLIEKTLPEAVPILREANKERQKYKNKTGIALTESEKVRHQQSLINVLDNMDKGKEIKKEQAIQALEDAAALVEAFPFDDVPISDAQIRKLVKIATGMSVTTKGKRQTSVFKEGEPAREVYLLRGVKLNLSWDKKLLSLEIDPKEMAIRAKLLSIVGIGSDTASDVSARHDDYFVESIDGR